ncbi:MAG: hypothetical protein R6W77_11055 [Trueperaceae bacterium]
MSVPWPEVWNRIAGDPLLLYSLAAAALLALVSWSSGLGRADLAALLRPRILLRVAGAVAVSFLVTASARTFVGATQAPTLAALLEGVGRLPLYLVTLAYGPSIGIAAAALAVGFAAETALPGWREAILALELVVLGWLAIYPSPRQARWAGPVDVALAHALAWGTGGVALLAFRYGEVLPRRWWSEISIDLAPVAVAAALLLAFGPRFYHLAFPGSRIVPEPRHEPTPGATVGSAGPVRSGTRLAEADMSAVPDLEDAGVHVARAIPKTVPKFRLPAGEAFDVGRQRGAPRKPWTPPRSVSAPRRAQVRPKRKRTLPPLPPLEDDPST